MKGLSPNTAAIFESVSRLECILPYTIVGGTALALQLGARQSEDLDFMSWRKSRNEKMEVDWPHIKREFESIGSLDNMDILDIDHVEFVLSGVKISFYANPNFSPVISLIPFLNNIVLADKLSIGAMKMEVMLRRSKFRDYYDIYSLILDNQDLNAMIEIALKYSRHRLKSKNLIAMLSNGERFVKDEAFQTLNPLYDVASTDIEALIKSKLQLLR